MDKIYTKTPLIPARKFHDASGLIKVWLKLENCQPVNSFKLRGISHEVMKAKRDGIQRLVIFSGGNAGLAAAYACKLIGIRLTVFIPMLTPDSTKQDLMQEGAEVIQIGKTTSETEELANIHVDQLRAQNIPVTMLHPFEGEVLHQGHSTIIDEVMQDWPVIQTSRSAADLFVCSVGGGGLFNGLCTGLQRHDAHHSHILALETEGADLLHAAVTSGEFPTQPRTDFRGTVALSLCAPRLSHKAWQFASTAADPHGARKVTCATVTDRQAVNACVQFADEYGMIVEPACGAALSVMYDRKDLLERFAGQPGRRRQADDVNVVLVVCGGRNVSLQTLMEYKKKFAL